MLVVSTAACGTVSVEVTSESDVGKVGVQSTLAPDDPLVTQTVPATTASTTASTTSTTTTSTTTTTVAPTIPLEYHDTGYAVFALAGDLEVRMPVSRYETVGFHESGHDGAFQLEAVNLDDWTTLASRGRGTGSSR